MKISKEKLEKAKQEAKDFYAKIGGIKCPYLKTKVNFNNEGFEHLLTASWNRGRSSIEQYTRLRLLPKAVEIIKTSHTLQEYDEKQIFVRQKTNSHWENKLKNIEYFIFVAFYPEPKMRFKVVIKHIEGGQPFFWSNYPSWKKIVNNNGNKKTFYSGNPEED